MKNAIVNAICCDLLIPVTSAKRFIYLLTKASESARWMRHGFIFVLDNVSEEQERKINDWYYNTRVTTTLPDVSIVKAPNGFSGNKAALFSSGIKVSTNPYIYFQNEKDELPINIDSCVNFLYKNKDYVACFGQCETFLEDGTLLEKFPIIDFKGNYNYDCTEASKLFPSYVHPLSAVFRKEVFDKVPYWDNDKAFRDFSYYYFLLRLLSNSEFKIKYMPYVVKIAKRSSQAASSISAKIRQDLVHDIKLWLTEFPDSLYRDFQLEILELLENGSITTFKEIDARIEDYLDRICVVK